MHHFFEFVFELFFCLVEAFGYLLFEEVGVLLVSLDHCVLEMGLLYVRVPLERACLSPVLVGGRQRVPLVGLQVVVIEALRRFSPQTGRLCLQAPLVPRRLGGHHHRVAVRCARACRLLAKLDLLPQPQ